MSRLVEAGKWAFFDVLADREATGAHVAMALRERLPATTIRSAPASSASADDRYPHLLHCRACAAGRSAADTLSALSAALESIDVLATSGHEPRARIVFRDELPAASAAYRAA